jgi:hypothetical protein
MPSASHDSNRRLVEGEWVDPGIPDPLSDMFALLTARRNRALIQQWGVWLAGKDAERALKVRRHAILFFGALRVPDVILQLLTSHGSAKRGQKAEDEAATLQQIRAVNPEAGVRFLEHLVLQKRRTVGLSLDTVCPIYRHVVTDTPFQDPTLHTSLAITYIEEVLSFLADDATSKLWRAKGVGLSTISRSPCTHRPILTPRHIVFFLLSSGILCILLKSLPISYLLRGNNPRVTRQTRATTHRTILTDFKHVRRVRSWRSPRTTRAIARTRARHHS